MSGKQEVVILGGGMAALTAAYELSKTQALRDRYSVTLYQRGWRLGGKCASSRAPHPADPQSYRIEEHGLHVWFGFYFNAFSMMHDCYAQLADPAMTVKTMFERRSDTPLMECIDDVWKVWPVTFPSDPSKVEPGCTPILPTLRQMIARLLEFLRRRLGEVGRGLEREQEAGFDSSVAWLKQVLASPAWDRPPSADDPHLITKEMSDLLEYLAAKPGNADWPLVRDNIRDLARTSVQRADIVRRAFILSDLAAAILRGLGAASIEIALQGLSALDDRDFRQWLGRWHASDESLESAPVRALYDLCFAYTNGDANDPSKADFAAGTALRCLLRIAFGYHGAVCYALTAGFGDAVVAPLYEVLIANGVRFEFFHKVEKLEARDGAITGIEFTVQAKVPKAYQPLKTAPDGMRFWPARPDFAQIKDGDVLSGLDEVNFESDLSPSWGGETHTRLDLAPRDGRRAIVVLGISMASLPAISHDLATPGSDWKKMLAGLPTVATQAAQLWMTVDLAGLGYRAPPPCMIAAPEPMDVWADMSSVIAREGWGAAVKPASVQYICGPMKEGNFANEEEARKTVKQTTADWIPAMESSPWGGIRYEILVATPGTRGRSRLDQQFFRANISGSERYVLSVAGSTKHRLRADALPAANLYLAGDWTRTGLDAGCVEAAVMSGKQAAFAIRGEDPDSVSGSHDWP